MKMKGSINMRGINGEEENNKSAKQSNGRAIKWRMAGDNVQWLGVFCASATSMRRHRSNGLARRQINVKK